MGGSPLRFAVVGAGPMGLMWARAIRRRSDIELAAVVDVDARQAKGTALRLRAPALAHDAIEAVAGGVDACVNVTPPQAHAEVVRGALDGGLHVLSEKPFTTSLDDALALVSSASSKGLTLFAAQTRTFEKGLTQLRDLASTLGELSLVRVDFKVGHPPQGFRFQMAHPVLQDMAVHAFDGVRFLTGRNATAVVADAANPPWSAYAGAATAGAAFEMEGGPAFLYQGSWCHPDSQTSWSGQWLVVGRNGMVSWDGIAAPVLGSHPDHAEADEPAGRTADPAAELDAVLAGFVDAIRAGSSHWCTASNNLGTVAMVESAVTAADHGGRVALDTTLPAPASDLA
jgi:predicted dehydrogenase